MNGQLYDKVSEDPKFRRAETKRMGVGFEVPKSLKTAKAKSDKFVVLAHWSRP
jgi:hypothetical protein